MRFRSANSSAPAKWNVFENDENIREVVWFADKLKLDAMTRSYGGRCGYEAVFNLFPWAIMDSNDTPLVMQLFESFVAEGCVRGVADEDYGLDSEKITRLARGLYREFVGMYAGLTRNPIMARKVLSLVERADLYVQPFYDAEAILISKDCVPQGHQLTELIQSRFESVKNEVIKRKGAIGADFVVNSGAHFQVYRMRDMVATQQPAWHVIDAWSMEEHAQGSITKDVFAARRTMAEGEMLEALNQYAFQNNPQAIAVVFRPKIAKDSDNMNQWLNLWEAANSTGGMFQRSLQ